MLRFGQCDDVGLGIRIGNDPHAASTKPVISQSNGLSDKALDREVLADARNALDALFHLMNSSLWAAREHLDATINDWGGGPSSSGELELPDTRPGQSTMGSVWVRLATPGLSGRYTAVTTGMVGVDGSVIPPHCITVKPDSFSLLSGIRQEADVHVDVPMGTPPGKYRGFLTVPEGLVANDGSATSEIVVPLTLLVAA